MEEISQVWRIWLSGGWVMLPLFVLALLLYAQAFQLVLVLRRIDIGSNDEMQWWQWVKSPGQAQGRVAEIIRYTQSDVSSAKQIRNRFEEIHLALVGLIDRRTRFVGTLVSAAPLLGLLGTVLGMLQTFFGISTGGGAETADVVAGGIAEALVTTEAGLMIALPGLFIVMVIHRRRHKFEARLARLESLTLTALRLD